MARPLWEAGLGRALPHEHHRPPAHGKGGTGLPPKPRPDRFRQRVCSSAGEAPAKLPAHLESSVALQGSHSRIVGVDRLAMQIFPTVIGCPCKRQAAGRFRCSSGYVGTQKQLHFRTESISIICCLYSYWAAVSCRASQTASISMAMCTISTDR